MSALHGKWSVDDIRKIMQSLDAKTGMDGASLPIFLCREPGHGLTLGTYHPSSNNRFRYFSFSLAYFNDKNFKDLAAIDVIRHEYCHYLVDALELETVYEDDDSHGEAWKTVCGLLNTDQYGTFREYYFPSATEKSLHDASESEDIKSVDIMEQIDRWGCQLPSTNRRKYLEKKLVKKYTKLRVFSAHDRVIHSKFGQGEVIDTMPCENKQMLYVKFYNSEYCIVQNRQVYKVVNGEVKKPASKA